MKAGLAGRGGGEAMTRNSPQMMFQKFAFRIVS